jgi:hypothetical protein
VFVSLADPSAQGFADPAMHGIECILVDARASDHRCRRRAFSAGHAPSRFSSAISP